MNELTRLIVGTLESMDPDSATAYLADLKMDVLRAVVDRTKNISETSVEDLVASLVSTARGARDVTED